MALAVHDKSVAEAKKHALASTDALLKEVWAHLVNLNLYLYSFFFKKKNIYSNFNLFIKNKNKIANC